MLLEYTIPCPFCGQLTVVEAEEGTPEADRMTMVRRMCRCDGAKNWRMAQDAYEKIDRAAGAGAVETGFDYAETEATVEILKKAADDVIARKIRQADLTAPGGDKYRLSMGMGEIKLKRVSKKELML